MDLQNTCKHSIAHNKACPWCGRKEAKGFPIKQPWQFYQGHFTSFMHSIAHESHGPLAIVVLAEDANGNVYSYGRGPDEKQMLLAGTYAEVVAERIGPVRKEEPCFAHKLKSGFEKLFN